MLRFTLLSNSRGSSSILDLSGRFVVKHPGRFSYRAILLNFALAQASCQGGSSEIRAGSCAAIWAALIQFKQMWPILRHMCLPGTSHTVCHLGVPPCGPSTK